MITRSLWLLWTVVIVACLPAILGAAADGSDASSCEWGTYRPNVYFGVRAKCESSPIFGLLWGAPFDVVSHVQEFRHDAEERDAIDKYGWVKHDGDSFGVQEILDTSKNVNLTTTFINVRHCRTHSLTPRRACPQPNV